MGCQNVFSEYVGHTVKKHFLLFLSYRFIFGPFTVPPFLKRSVIFVWKQVYISKILVHNILILRHRDGSCICNDKLSAKYLLRLLKMTAWNGDSFSVLTRVIRFSFCLKGIVQMFNIRCFLTGNIHACTLAQSTHHMNIDVCFSKLTAFQTNNIINKKNDSPFWGSTIFYQHNAQPSLYHWTIIM